MGRSCSGESTLILSSSILLAIHSVSQAGVAIATVFCFVLLFLKAVSFVTQSDFELRVFLLHPSVRMLGLHVYITTPGSATTF